MLPCLAFLPRGSLAQVPTQYEMNESDLQGLIDRQSGLSIDEAKKKLDESVETIKKPKAKKAAKATAVEDPENPAMEDSDDSDSGSDLSVEGKPNATEEELLEELNMDDYQDEPDGAELFLGGKSLMVHESNSSDPYITMPDEEDEDSEAEDDFINPTDYVIAAGRSEAPREDRGEPQSSVEIYLYDSERGSIFVHHDFPVPSFPLVLEFMNRDPRVQASDVKDGNDTGAFLAVGQIEATAGIEIWNLDVLDVLEPVAIMGGLDAAAPANKQKSKKKPALSAGSHTEAVLSLSWHEKYRERLASGSADKTVKLWDVTSQKCVNTFSAVHSAPVQSIQFNPFEPQLLLTGSYDRTAALFDVRSPNAPKKFSLTGEVEQLKFSPHVGNYFLVALSDGNVQLWDIKANKSLFTLAAHDGECTSISWNSCAPGVFSSGGVDGIVKIWKISDEGKPEVVGSKSMKIGKIMAAAWDKSSPFILAAGGDKDNLALWDSAENKEVESQINFIVNKANGNQESKSTETKENKDSAIDEDAAADAASEEKAAKKAHKKKNKK